MPNVEFDDNPHTSNKDDNNTEGITGWIQETFNVSYSSARKVLVTIGVIALVVSLYFWFQLLL